MGSAHGLSLFYKKIRQAQTSEKPAHLVAGYIARSVVARYKKRASPFYFN